MGGTAMSPAQALQVARAAGIHIKIDGGHLLLEAAAEPPAAILDLLSRNKASILTMLQPRPDGWSAEDWHIFFEERASIGEFEGGLSRAKAEAQAFDHCVIEWLNRNPAVSAFGRCLECGRGERPGDPLLPFGTKPSGHVWLHDACWPAWHRTRKADAVAALRAMGIQA